MGGATGVIGDPSGRTKERSVLSETQLAKNISGISATLAMINKNVEEVIPNDRYSNNMPRLPIRFVSMKTLSHAYLYSCIALRFSMQLMLIVKSPLIYFAYVYSLSCPYKDTQQC